MKYALLQKNDISKYEAYLSYLTREEMLAPSVQFMGAFDEENSLYGVAAFTSQMKALLLGVQVAECKKKKEIGAGLVEAIYDLLRKNGGEWITSIIPADHNDDYFTSREFLWSCGMNPGEVYSSGEVDLKDALNNPVFAKAKSKVRKTPGLCSLADVPKGVFFEQWNEYNKKASMHFPIFDKNIIDYDVSTVLYEDHQVKGWVLIGKDEDGISVEHALILSSLIDKALIVVMFEHSLEKLNAKYPNEKSINAVFQNEVSMLLFSKLFGKSAKFKNQMMYYMNFNRAPEVYDFEDTDSGYLLEDIDDDNMGEDFIDAIVEDLDEDSYDDLDDTMSGSFLEDPVFEIVTNEIMICKDCIYCVYGDVLSSCS